MSGQSSSPSSGIARCSEPFGGKYEHSKGRAEHNDEIDCKGIDIQAMVEKNEIFKKGRQEIDVGGTRDQKQTDEHAHDTGYYFANGKFKEIVLQDKCDSSLLESKERLLRNASKGLQEEQEKEQEEEEEEEEPKPKEQLSFAEIMKLAKAPKVEKKKEPVKPILKVTKAPKMTKEEIKEKFTQLKYEVRSINHKGQQLHDNCLKDRSRIEQVLKVTLAEVDRLKEAEKEADSL